VLPFDNAVIHDVKKSPFARKIFGTLEFDAFCYIKKGMLLGVTGNRILFPVTALA
jgi:hypothetical protein